jgi:hypothetical protein
MTAETITISLLGAPQGKGRARAFLRGSHIGHYTPEKTRAYEGMIRTVAMQELAGRPAFDEPVEFVLRAIFPVPPGLNASGLPLSSANSSRARSLILITSRRPGTTRSTASCTGTTA